MPDFQYYLVPIRNYTNEELLERADEISLVMLFNKLQNEADVAELRKLSPKKLEEILRNSPGRVVKVIADVLFAFLLKANVPVEEAEELVGKVKEKKMAELFENMEKMDIQAERRNTAEQRARADRAENEVEKAKAIIEEGIQLFVETCKEFSMPREEVILRLVAKYKMSRLEAEERLAKYWS